MSDGLPTIGVTEATGLVALGADVDKLCVVIGCTSAGSGLSLFFRSGASCVAARGYGDAVDTACQMIEQKLDTGTAAKVPVAIYSCTASTAGSYGTIGAAGVAGTCDPVVGSTAPYGTYEAAIYIVDDGNDGGGGAVGTSGIVYQWSLSGGRQKSERLALGTATSIAIPNSNVSFDLDPPSATLTALYAKLNDLKDKLAGTGHFVLTSSSVHASADTTNDTALTAVANATTKATAVTLFNAIKTRLGSHGANATVHAAADTVLATALAAIPTAVNVADVDLYTDNLVAAYEAHRVLQPSVHGAADSTYTVSAYTPGPGTLITDDTWTVRTLAPKPDSSAVAAAFTALSTSTATFSMVALEFPVDAALAATVKTGLNALASKGKDVTALVRTRIADAETAETDTAWTADVIDDWKSPRFDESRICVLAGYGLVRDAMTSREYMRSGFAPWMQEVVATGISSWPGCPAQRKVQGFKLVDSDGVLVGHDEGELGAASGLSSATTQANRFVSFMRFPIQTELDNVYTTVPWVMFAANEITTFCMLPVRRVGNAMKAVAVSADVSGIGSEPGTVTDANGVTTLKPASRKALQAKVFSALSARFAEHIQNANDAAVDTGLLQIDPIVTLDVTGKIATVTKRMRPKMKTFVGDIAFVLEVT